MTGSNINCAAAAIQMGQTWASMFEFLEASSTPDADADCTAIFAAGIMADPPATLSSLEVRIPRVLNDRGDLPWQTFQD